MLLLALKPALLLVFSLVVPSGVGDDTTDGAAKDATTNDGGAHTDGIQSKKQRKDQRPNALRAVKEEFTQVQG